MDHELSLIEVILLVVAITVIYILALFVAKYRLETRRLEYPISIIEIIGACASDLQKWWKSRPRK